MNAEGNEKKEACGCGTCGGEIAGCCQGEMERNAAATPKGLGISVDGTGCGCSSANTAESASCCGESKNRIDPARERADASCSCGDAVKEKVVHVEYLYLDLTSCSRCIGTDRVLDEVVSKLTPMLEMAGYAVTYSKMEIETEEMAKSYQFMSSPTIRVNGRDITLSVQESQCGCCSDISGTDVDCRVFEYEGQSYEIPPKEMLTESIIAAVFTESACCAGANEYRLPENLKQFYAGKSKKCANENCC
jgi:hypothetical protein